MYAEVGLLKDTLSETKYHRGKMKWNGCGSVIWIFPCLVKGPIVTHHASQVPLEIFFMHIAKFIPLSWARDWYALILKDFIMNNKGKSNYSWSVWCLILLSKLITKLVINKPDLDEMWVVKFAVFLSFLTVSDIFSCVIMRCDRWCSADGFILTVQN